MSNGRLHIAHFTNTYFPVMSGVVRSISSFRQAQVDLGHNVFIFAQEASDYQDTQPFIFRYPSLNIPIRNYPITIPVSPLIDWVLPILKLDVIHAHHPALIGAAASDKAEKLNVPLVFTHHTRYQEYAQSMGLPEELMGRIIERAMADYMQKCQHIIAPSSSIKQLIEETYGIKEGISVVPTGIDLESYRHLDGQAWRQKFGWSEAEMVLISVGRLVEEKNFATLLKAAQIVIQRQPQVRLALLGDGPARQDLESLAAQLGIAAQVTFVGAVPFADIPSHLKAADIFCFASVTETQGLATLEAMAAGLPVTAVNATGTADIVQPEVSGLLTENTPQSLAAGIERLVTDVGLRAHLCAGATARAQEYEIHHTAQQLVDIYQQAIESRRANRAIITDRQKPIFGLSWERLFDGLKGLDEFRQV